MNSYNNIDNLQNKLQILNNYKYYHNFSIYNYDTSWFIEIPFSQLQ